MVLNLPSLSHLERYRNEGTRTYSPHAGYTEAQRKYRPDGGLPSFSLPCFAMPRERMHVYSANPPGELARIYTGADDVRFCIHPQVLDERADDPYVVQTLKIGAKSDPLQVEPGASTRTLHVLNGPPDHAVKVHFPFRISRYGRKMREEVIEQAINVSRELEAGIEKMDGRFAFLREVIGVAHANLHPESPRGENWGYLVRDMRPFPHVVEKRTLVPGFSLYGKDFYDPGKSILLFDLIGSANPLEFVLESILLPIIRHWVGCFLHFGYLIEPHGQNVLLEIDENGVIKRVVHRDLSVGIDMRRRRDLGLSDAGLNAYNRMEAGHFLSITYDKFMGGHFFDRIVDACLKRYPHLTADDFRAPCRTEFQHIFPDNPAYFPRTVQYFSEERDAFGKPFFIDTGKMPAWR
ncbi:MAG: hypothetical protein DSY90_05800 [Deltaproteobacteria bacterium]|nr:MAG: hypothetical protein DSY90_05800 [Deltaproteobacteria bacterium]RUA02771.1 MAG: hypothetical protein DSY89_02220 [Deltaproteobacteria bacterium]